MSLNLGTATSLMNKLFGAFSPQRWKQDLFYRNIGIGKRAGKDSTLINTEELGLQIQEAYQEYSLGAEGGFSTTRGLLAIDSEPFDKSKTLYFQFNPETISDAKTVEYADRLKPGFDNADYIWSKGGGRVISFELMLDATLSSNYEHIKTSNRFTHDTERGTLNQVEFLQSLVRPYEEKGTTPLFSTNGVVPSRNRFASPPQVIFAYGPIYLEGVVTDISLEHEAFKINLAPIRTKATVTFRVREDIQVNQATNYSPKKAVGAESVEPKTLKTTGV